MPRKKNICPRSAHVDTVALDDETLEALLFGHAIALGGSMYWETAARCAAAWSLHRDEILSDPSWSAQGRRPAGWYISEAVPFRDAGSGPTFRIGAVVAPVPLPTLGCEATHLHRLGKIDDDELFDHRASGMHDVWCEGRCPHQSRPRQRRRRAAAHA